MSDGPVKLSAGLAIDGATPGEPRGRVGFLVFDDNLLEYVLVTAAQITGASNEIFVNEVPVARASVDQYPDYLDPKVNPASALLRFAPLLPDGMVDTKQPHRTSSKKSGTLLVDPSSIIGDEVMVHVSETLKIPAQLVSATAQFRLRLPNSDTSILFTDAIELKSADGKPVTIKGETGALVTTIDGHPVGLIVSGTRERSFAAPLADGIKRRMKSWHVHSPPRIRQYNESKLEHVRRDQESAETTLEPIADNKEKAELVQKVLKTGTAREQKAKGGVIGNLYLGKASDDEEEDE